MTRWASGSIQVVTKVARLRIGSPSRISSSPISRMASTAGIPCSGRCSSGAGFEQEAVAEPSGELVDLLAQLDLWSDDMDQPSLGRVVR